MTEKVTLDSLVSIVHRGSDSDKLAALNQLCDMVDYGFINAGNATYLTNSLIHIAPYENNEGVTRETFYLLEKLIVKFFSNFSDIDYLIERTNERPDLIAKVLTLLAIDRRLCFKPFVEQCINNVDELVRNTAMYALKRIV